MKNIQCLLALILCLSFFFPGAAFAADLAGYARISGNVKDSITGLPINDAKVLLICGIYKFNLTTNSLGYYEFSKVPIYSKKNKLINSAEITVSAQQYISIVNTKDLFPGQAYVIDFKLQTRYAYPIVKGRVFDNSSLTGIPYAVVTATRNNKIFSAVTDTQGNYILRIETKIPLTYSITAKADAYADSLPETVRVFAYQTYNIDIPLDALVLGISVSPDTWQIGSLGPNAVAVMQPGQQITVTNTGNINQTYSLMVISPEAWTASQSAVDREQYIINACFSSNIYSVSWNEQNHALLETLQRCSEIKFAGDQNGVNIMPNQQRTLWMQFKAPLATTIRNQQVIEVIINAEMP